MNIIQEEIEIDEEKTKDDEIEIVLQINGKVRDKLVIPAGLSKEERDYYYGLFAKGEAYRPYEP